MQIPFEVFQDVCRFHGCAYDINKEVVDVCRSPRRCISGSSWAECEEKSCPFCANGNNARIGKQYADGFCEGFSKKGTEAIDDRAKSPDGPGSDGK